MHLELPIAGSRASDRVPVPSPRTRTTARPSGDFSPVRGEGATVAEPSPNTGHPRVREPRNRLQQVPVRTRRNHDSRVGRSADRREPDASPIGCSRPLLARSHLASPPQRSEKGQAVCRDEHLTRECVRRGFVPPLLRIRQCSARGRGGRGISRRRSVEVARGFSAAGDWWPAIGSRHRATLRDRMQKSHSVVDVAVTAGPSFGLLRAQWRAVCGD
jgi:hypothetical protein